MTLGSYLKRKRKELNLTQEELSMKAGVGLRFIRELEQGKNTLRMDKVNQVLHLFGSELGVVTKIYTCLNDDESIEHDLLHH